MTEIDYLGVKIPVRGLLPTVNKVSESMDEIFLPTEVDGKEIVYRFAKVKHEKEGWRHGLMIVAAKNSSMGFALILFSKPQDKTEWVISIMHANSLRRKALERLASTLTGQSKFEIPK